MNREERRWRGAVSRARKRLWLEQHDVASNVVDEMTNDHPGKSDEFESIAKTTSISHYMMANLAAKRSAVESKSDAELDELACHEMLHVVLSPITDFVETFLDDFPAEKKKVLEKWWDRTNERVTEHLTRVIFHG